ncbi:hypothetical protein [Dietzia sp. NCCP-2495]|uniref:Gp37-like protein n=1 Tax=Dietzia sp. NCCP-2495 TaxID=2934675 RepID=UPI00222E3763|nr:hypothetical protein [Dietzia sp. NCCP-2495]
MTTARSMYAALTADEKAERDTYGHPRAHVRFMSKFMQVWSPCGDYAELKFTEKENAPGGLVILVPDDEHWGEYFYGQPRDTARPIVVDLPGWRTMWLTVSFTRTRKGKRRYIEVSAVHCIEYLNWMRIWPDPGLPAEFQPSKWRMPIGPAATVCAAIMIPELQRLQGDLWPIMTHARFYREPDNTSWTNGVYRMDKVYDAVLDICEAENLQMVPTLYIHGEDEQPFPQHHVLHRTTLIFDFVPRSNSRAFTGTLSGGLLRTGIEIAQDLFEWVQFPVADPQDPRAIDDLAGRDGEVFPVYSDGEWSPVDEVSQTVHIQMARRFTGGGKSPDFINDVVIGGLEALVRGIAGFFQLEGFLPDFLAERAKDVAMAFHSVKDRRADEVQGPWALHEAFTDSQATGLSLQVAQALKSTAYAHRGYTSHAITVENGMPYLVGRHIRTGWPVGVEMRDGTVEVDRVSEVTYEDSRSARGRITLQIGSGDAELEPGMKGLTKLRRFAGWIHRVSMGG